MIILWITVKFFRIIITDNDYSVDDDNPVDDDDELGYCVVFDCVCYSMNGETGMSHAERRAQLEAANKVVFTF